MSVVRDWPRKSRQSNEREMSFPIDGNKNSVQPSQNRVILEIRSCEGSIDNRQIQKLCLLDHGVGVLSIVTITAPFPLMKKANNIEI